jgi:outer membrane lipoprotein
MAKRMILAALLCVLLSGCTSVLSNQIVQEADGKIAFPDLLKQPDRFRGAVVILGGQIIETVARENETWVQVLQLPLKDRQQPDHTAASQGRFLVVYPRFADPLIYEKGRKITVGGVVEGGRVITIGGRPYTVPSVLERETYLWRPEDDYPGAGSGPAVQFGIGFGIWR